MLLLKFLCNLSDSKISSLFPTTTALDLLESGGGKISIANAQLYTVIDQLEDCCTIHNTYLAIKDIFYITIFNLKNIA